MTPGRYACDLLGELGIDAPHLTPADPRDESTLWAASGAQYLTGERNGPPLPSPAPLATSAQGAWLALAALSAGTLEPVFPAYKLLGERAAILGLKRQGAVSPGGACHLLNCANGQIALNLPRDEDWRLLPAWLECPVDSWESITRELLNQPCDSMVARARLLGLAAAASRPPLPPGNWFNAERLAPEVKHQRHQPLVIDLSTIWAGPLCAQLLGEMGARVVKVESTTRPDGARAGSPRFFDLLNANKQSVTVDLGHSDGRRQLRQLLACADIIIESARPRGLEQMGILATDIVREGSGQVWLSITGYGREAPMHEWIAYGDDAGVAAGLSALQGESSGCNVFCGDAIADPLTGLHAAVLAWDAWTHGGGVLLDVSLCGVLARCIASAGDDGQAITTPSKVLPPSARTPSGPAAALGSNTAEVFLEFGITT